MKNKNNLFISIICILIIIIIVLISWIIISSNNKKLDQQANGEKTNNEIGESNKVESNFDLVEAENLINKYSGLFDAIYDINERVFYGPLINDYKVMVAYNNLDKQKIGEISDSSEFLSYFDNSEEVDAIIASTNLWEKIKYQDLNESYKYLFGTDLEKTDYHCLYNTLHLVYSSSTDTYIKYTRNSSSGSPYYYSYAVESANTKNSNGDDNALGIADNRVIINILCARADLTLDGFKSQYTDKIYSLDDEEEFINSESKYFDKYEFIFKYENDHYILLDIVKK